MLAALSPLVCWGDRGLFCWSGEALVVLLGCCRGSMFASFELFQQGCRLQALGVGSCLLPTMREHIDGSNSTQSRRRGLAMDCC